MSPYGFTRVPWIAVALVVAGCSPSGPVTVTLDGRPYAILQPQGWVHASGELALPVRGTDVAVSGSYLAANDFVECSSGRCSSERFAADVYIEGGQVFMGGVPRGSLTDFDAFGRQSAVLLLELYDPPGSVFASKEVGFDHERLSVGVLRDGRIVQGERCPWRETCASLPTLGTWTDDQLVFNGTVHRLTDLVEVTDKIRVRRAPDLDWELRFSSSAEPNFNSGVYGWPVPDWLRLDFERPQDADLGSPMAYAAFAALTFALHERAKAIPPPPLPPPAADNSQ